MLDFEIERFVPAFIRNDRNGNAMTAAIGAAMDYFCEKISDGIDCIRDYDEMPEWRLDELAWEYDCLYDYTADVEKKRKWIKNSTALYRMYGTVAALYKYLEGYFESLVIEEASQYGGSAFHFRVMVDGQWSQADATWAAKAIGEAKNVRSVLDGIMTGSRGLTGVVATGGVSHIYAYLKCAQNLKCGGWQELQ